MAYDHFDVEAIAFYRFAEAECRHYALISMREAEGYFKDPGAASSAGFSALLAATTRGQKAALWSQLAAERLRKLRLKDDSERRHFWQDVERARRKPVAMPITGVTCDDSEIHGALKQARREVVQAAEALRTDEAAQVGDFRATQEREVA